MNTTTTLDEVAREAAVCTKCRLSAGRTQVVFGVGHPHADLMFIGEAPGFHEDKQGEPFVGAAGQLLTTLLGEIGLRREDVYICNVLRCLRYNALVQLGDGSWERIGRLVRTRYDGSVMSVDAEGRLVPRRVIGWYATPLAGRRVYRLSYRSAKKVGQRGRVSIQLTADHPVLTERGYVAVSALEPGDRIATGQGLSALAMDVVCGTVLGDGHLNASSSYLYFRHSSKQREYALFKCGLLGELNPTASEFVVALAAGEERTRTVIDIRTVAHRALGILRNDFYVPTKRVPWWLMERFNARMLAIWFMDDGHTRIRPPRQPRAEIATNSFAPEDLFVLLRCLARLGLLANVQRGRLYFDVENTTVLSELIAPYVPDSMRYKLHPEMANRIPFDPARYQPSAPEVMYDDVHVDEIHHTGSDQTFFCIDVDETHNFVTSGGVVHNCRPPGNRDPLPDEIESCKSWLDQTLSLVDPRIIVTLGNFATRFILDRPVGISRVRGERFHVDGRMVIPTFHPAAILRGGGAASKQMEAVRQDFQTVKEALADVPPPPPEEQLGLF